jgi:hypothetical protein
MMKFVITVALAAALCTPGAAAQSVLQKSDWKARSFERSLPPPTERVPWLKLDIRDKPPKQDLPLGWQANAFPPFALHPLSPDMRVSSKNASPATL